MFAETIKAACQANQSLIYTIVDLLDAPIIAWERFGAALFGNFDEVAPHSALSIFM